MLLQLERATTWTYYNQPAREIHDFCQVCISQRLETGDLAPCGRCLESPIVSIPAHYGVALSLDTFHVCAQPRKDSHTSPSMRLGGRPLCFQL